MWIVGQPFTYIIPFDRFFLIAFCGISISEISDRFQIVWLMFYYPLKPLQCFIELPGDQSTDSKNHLRFHIVRVFSNNTEQFLYAFHCFLRTSVPAFAVNVTTS